MVEINWTRQSIKDIDNIAEFISKDSEKYARIQTQRFFESVQVLSTYPKAGKLVPEIDNENIREIILGGYRIIYRIKNKTRIDILTVHHSKRLLTNNPIFKR